MNTWGHSRPDREPIKYGFWWSVAAFVIIIYAATYFTDAKPLQEFLRLLNVAFSVGVVTAYLPESLKRALKPRLESADLLLIGITIGWFGQAFVSSWVLLWRLAGQPSWMINSDVTNVAVAVQVMGCALHLVAPGAIGGMVPRRNMVVLGMLAAATAAVALLFAMESPVISNYLREMRPVIESPRNGYDSSWLRPYRDPGNASGKTITFVKS